MAVGTNGPPVLNGSAYVYPEKTLAKLRRNLLIKLGYAAQLAAPPPGMEDLLDVFLQDANEQLYQRYETLRQRRWWTIAITQGNRHYDIPYEGAYLENADIAINSASPDTLVTSGDWVAGGFTVGMIINISGSDADDGYHEIATVNSSTIELTSSTTVTGEVTGTNTIRVTEDSFVNLDPREVAYAGLLDGTKWDDMIAGFDPLLFNIDSQQRPVYYEIREFVEVFPEPDQAYTMYIAGRSALKPFTADAHVTSVDPAMVYLQALAEAKAHYGQRDASVYFQRLEGMLGDLNSKTFGNERFIPNPKPHLPSLPYPQTTFIRG